MSWTDRLKRKRKAPEEASEAEPRQAASPLPEGDHPAFPRLTPAERDQLAALLAPALDEELARLATLRRWNA